MNSLEPFIHRKVVTLRQDATVVQAARAMCEKAIGCVIISDHNGHIVGIVTDRDLACAILAESRPHGLPVARIMSTPPVTAGEAAGIEGVLGLMEMYGIRRIPIIQPLNHGRQRCVGVVTLDDLIAANLVEPEQLARIVQFQTLRRVSRYQVSEAKGDLPGFYREISNRAGLKAIGLDRASSYEVIELVLDALIERLHHTAAVCLVVQLPEALQEKLLRLPNGPDRTVTLPRVVFELESRFGLTEDMARSALRAVCGALDEVLDYENFGHVKAQLPKDLRDLFISEEPAA
jgi:CBS domain-containing protein/uncharacterized protein (DUF2267 family)